MSETQSQDNASRIIPFTPEEHIYLQQKDLREEVRESRKEQAARMDRLETRMDRLEVQLIETRKEINARMDRLEARQDKLDAKFDKLADKIDSSTKHSQILAGSCLGITIAVYTFAFL